MAKIRSYAVFLTCVGVYVTFPASVKSTAVSTCSMMDSDGLLILCSAFMRAMLSLRSAGAILQ